MIEPNRLLGYLRASCRDLLERGTIGVDEWPQRPAQREAFEAYAAFLDRTDLSDAQKLKGFFEIPTGVGKTAVFAALIEGALRHAAVDGVQLRIGIVAPTTNLLTQTRDDLIRFYPSLAASIGLYGGTERTGDKPITIITYASWANLVDRGELTSDSFDLLIADEAHRGTSIEREKRLAEVFDGIGKLAFTATAHYDPDKTVYNTHEYRIFEKHIAASVSDGELASYIQTQRYVLRVAPEKAESDKSEDNRLVRQLAFNRFVEQLLLTGTDEYTGDRLTDNQGAIFVDSTAQADLLAARLNANDALQAIARAHGCENFAVSIHTNEINTAEQIRREADYKAGKYLFVVGDEKFKEGFDHRPLKTIIDMPHGSLVDKAQILGRGLRQWFNPVKNRLEGMAFVDTIIYIGSDDPEADRLARETAIARTILATDVLDGQVLVTGPGAPEPLPPKKPKPPGGPPPPVDWPDDLTVTVFSTLDDVQTFLSEREKLRTSEPMIEDWPTSPEYRALTELRQRKGNIGGMALYQFAQEDGDTKSILGSVTRIHNIITANVNTVSVAQLQALTHLFEQQSDGIINWPESPEYRALTELRRRKGNVGTTTLYQLAQEDEAAKNVFTSPGLIKPIISEGARAAKKVTIIQLQVLTRLLAGLPDTESKLEANIITDWPESPEYRALAELRQRKGNVAGRILYQSAREDIDAKNVLASEPVIRDIIMGITKTITIFQLHALTRLLDQKPDTVMDWPTSPEFETFTQLRKRKGNVGGKTLYKFAQEDEYAKNVFISTTVINPIISGKAKTISIPQLQALTRLLEQQPDVIMDWPTSSEYRALTELRQRKGNVGGITLFQFAQQDENTKDLFASVSVIDLIINGVVKTVPIPPITSFDQPV